jgi:hypothetical protein
VSHDASDHDVLEVRRELGSTARRVTMLLHVSGDDELPQHALVRRGRGLGAGREGGRGDGAGEGRGDDGHSLGRSFQRV